MGMLAGTILFAGEKSEIAMIARHSSLLISLLITSAICELVAETTFLVDFDRGYDAVFAKGNVHAIIPADASDTDIQLVDGKFGKGVFIGRNVKALSIGYNAKDNFSSAKGTVEFWFRPVVMENLQQKEPLKYRSLFATSGDPSGYSMGIDQYGNMMFVARNNYRYIGAVAFSDHNIGNWHYIAVCWDEGEARFFYDGKLEAVSGFWNIPPTGQVITLGSLGYGEGNGADGVFDDFRISDGVRYVGAFPLPQESLMAEKDKITKRVDIDSSTKEIYQDKILSFVVDYAKSPYPLYTEGSPDVWLNYAGTMELIDGKKALRLSSRHGGIGDVLSFEADGNMNRASGKMEIEAKLARDFKLPISLFDSTCPKSNKGISGIKLFIDRNSCLERITIENNIILSQIISRPIKLGIDQWNTYSMSWNASKVRLLFNKEIIVEEEEVPIQTYQNKYFSIGSNYLGAGTFDGWISSIRIFKGN